MDAEIFKSEKEGMAVLQFTITEGKKVQIERIRFFGNTVFKDKKLVKQMKKTKVNRWYGGGDFDKDKFVEDKELEKAKELNALDGFYNSLSSRLSEWPIKNKSLKKFFGSIVVLLLPILVPYVVKFLISLFAN